MSKLPIALLSLLLLPTAANAAPCALPAGFKDLPPPAIGSVDSLVSHTEEVLVERPLAAILAAANKPLEKVARKTSSLPGVAGSIVLTHGEFGAPGSRRLNCLTDGSTLEEQSLERTQGAGTYRFRYIVWNYTSKVAQPIHYSVGEFHFMSDGPGRSRIVWTYSFKLDEHRFPGYLGSLGRFLFRVTFLDRQYAELMRSVLNGYRRDALARPATTEAGP
jgi:hypothetical protein